jgi:hypothetical protein
MRQEYRNKYGTSVEKYKGCSRDPSFVVSTVQLGHKTESNRHVARRRIVQSTA